MDKLQVRAPYNGELLKELTLIDESQAKQMLTTAYALYKGRDGWLSTHNRREILENAASILTEKKSELAMQAATEGGKPLMDSIVEVERAILGIKSAIASLSQMTGQEIPMNMTPSSAGRMAYTYREPAGVVMAISAFNHPLNLIVHQIIPAIATGCPVLIKPASSTPLSCLSLVNILYESGLPKSWCQVLLCANNVAENLVSDSRINFLSFVGSAKVGWYLRSKLAPGTHCALEHGGAAPLIIHEDADLDRCIPLLVKGGFYHAGQVCVSVQRVFVHQKIIKALAKKLTNLAKKLIVGDPKNIETEVGPLISYKEVKRVHDWVQQAINGGAKLLTGGKILSETCYEPTVLLDPPMDLMVSTHEIFGPVICLYSYSNYLAAIELANKPAFFFQAAVFTQDIDLAFDCVKRLNATTVMINDHTAFRVDWMPFGGRKQSGLGMAGIPYSMLDMTHEKMFVLQSPSLL